MVLVQFAPGAALPQAPNSLQLLAFTFSYAATAAYALRWIHLTQFAGAAMLAYVVLAAITLFIGAIALRSLVALWQGKFYLLQAMRNRVLAQQPPFLLLSLRQGSYENRQEEYANACIARFSCFSLTRSVMALQMHVTVPSAPARSTLSCWRSEASRCRSRQTPCFAQGDTE